MVLVRTPGIDYDPARGERIRRLRKSRRLTQVELADLCGVHDRTISNWEAGKGIPKVHINLLAEKLRSTADYLLDGDEALFVAARGGGEGDEESDDARLEQLEARVSRTETALRERIDELEGRLGAAVDLLEVLAPHAPLPIPQDELTQRRGAPRQAGENATDS